MSSLMVSILERLSAIEHRLSVMNIAGKVTDVDPAKGLYRQTIGKDADGQDVKSPWIPYSQHAGALKAHVPPSVGQQMVLLSNGSIESAVGIPFSWSDSNAQPNVKGDENTLTFRGVKIDLTNGLKLTIGGVTFNFTGSGFEQTGGAQKHDGVNTGKDHRHDLVVSGNDLTGLPQP